MKTRRKIIAIDEKLCDGCGQCVISCAEGALQIIEGKARVVSDNLCDGIGACIGECPQGALQVVEREAEEFDPEAVEDHLARLEARKEPSDAETSRACPSGRMQEFGASPSPAESAGAAEAGALAGRLSHWPVKIRLVPEDAPFLKGAHLLVLADCAAVAYAALHSELLAGRVVMMGCPKFEDIKAYEEKFARIFQQAGIASVTVVPMEVPCCSGLAGMVQKALEAGGETLPLREVLISTRGAVLSDTTAKTPAEKRSAGAG
ncbi:MAG TPA: 4Fe-4S dicluster domain-containing protein [Desulfosalsimonadaceae bacterium]|nr:4Fe-4S dicluster domain-containing protein [Desulfosalsimonadaceae bacterium]